MGKGSARRIERSAVPVGESHRQNRANYYGQTNAYSYDLGPNQYNPIGSVGGTSPATSPVGTFDVNGYGLYDMAGNVFQWCWDGYGTVYRVWRGGSWQNDAYAARCAYRAYDFPINAQSSSASGVREDFEFGTCPLSPRANRKGKSVVAAGKRVP